MGLYSVRHLGNLTSVLYRLTAAFTFGMLTISILTLWYPTTELEPGSLVILVILSVASFGTLRVIYHKFIDGNKLIRRVLVLGTGKKAHTIEQLRHEPNQRGFNLVGFISSQSEHSSLISQQKIIPTQDTLCEYALAQLWNILKKDMRLVGPRPERPEFVAELSKINPLYKERHRVNSGLAGWAQLCYPYGASKQDSMEKLQYDLFYVKNYRLMLDIYILLQTVEVVLIGKKGEVISDKLNL